MPFKSIEEGWSGCRVFPFMRYVAKDIPLCAYFSPHKQKCCRTQLQSSREPGKERALIWAAESCKALCWNWSRCRAPPPSSDDHKHPVCLFQHGIFINSVLGCGCWYWLYFHCRGGCMGIAQLRKTMMLPALWSRQWWGTAALQTSFFMSPSC